MRLSASFELLSGLSPFRSDHVISGVASTILDGEVSTVTSLSLSLKVSIQPQLRSKKGHLLATYTALPAYTTKLQCNHHVPIYLENHCLGDINEPLARQKAHMSCITMSLEVPY